MEDKHLDQDMKIEALKESIISVTDEKLSWEEIKRRVAQGDIVYIIALNIAKRKIDGLFLIPPFPFSYIFFRT